MFLQKVLGNKYKWWYVLQYWSKVSLSYRVDWFFFASGHFITILTSVFLAMQFYNQKEYITYFLVGNCFYSLFFHWPAFFGFDIFTGKISRDLITPTNFKLLMFFKYFGLAVLQNIMTISFSIFLIYFYRDMIVFTNDSNRISVILMFLPISLLNHFFVEFLIGCLAFYVTQINGLLSNYAHIRNLFSGRLIPLNFLAYIFIFTPFAFTFYHPAMLYFGKYNQNQTFLVFIGGLAWCVILYILAKIIFKLGLKKNESVGL
jgi:ABC-2 type transport system permease protein